MQKLPKSVLVIEDDPDVAFSIKETLIAEGFAVTCTASGAEAAKLIGCAPIDLAVVDLCLPDISGFDLLKGMSADREFGVIVLSARAQTVDIVLGLELGADDYVTKPFEPREFVARVRRVLRQFARVKERRPEPVRGVRFPGWSYDANANRVAHIGGRVEKLTTQEARLLHIFIEHPNMILSRDRLLEFLHPVNSDTPFDRSIDVTVTRLRRKVEMNARHPRFIKTVHGNGYLFDPKGE